MTQHGQPIEASSIERAERAIRMHTAKLATLRSQPESAFQKASITLSEHRIAQYTAAIAARKEGK